MKKLIIINGAPGAGKTSVCKELYQKLENSAWLDGDWCWMMNPFKVTDENKQMVEKNINCILTNFIKNSSIDYVVFDWVIPHDGLMNRIIAELPLDGMEVHKISLVCSEDVLRKRLKADGRSLDRIEDSVRRLDSYQSMNTIKLDTTDKSVKEIVEHLVSFVK